MENTNGDDDEYNSFRAFQESWNSGGDSAEFSLIEQGDSDLGFSGSDDASNWSPSFFSLDGPAGINSSGEDNSSSSEIPQSNPSSFPQTPSSGINNESFDIGTPLPLALDFEAEPLLTNFSTPNNAFGTTMPPEGFDFLLQQEDDEEAINKRGAPHNDDTPMLDARETTQQQQQNNMERAEKARMKGAKRMSLTMPRKWVEVIHPGVLEVEHKDIVFIDESGGYKPKKTKNTPTSTGKSTSAPKRKRIEDESLPTQEGELRLNPAHTRSAPVPMAVALVKAMEYLQQELLLRTQVETQLALQLAHMPSYEQQRDVMLSYIDHLRSISTNVRTAFKKSLTTVTAIDPIFWSLIGHMLSDTHGDYSSFLKLAETSTTLYNFFNTDATWLFSLGRELSWDLEGDIGDASRDAMLTTYITHHSAFLRMASDAQQHNAPLELWRAAKRLVELRWRVRTAFTSKKSEEYLERTKRRTYVLTGHVLDAMPTMVCMPESPWIFAVSANGVAMWQAGIRDIFVKARFSQSFLGVDQLVSRPLHCRPVLVAMPTGATLLVGNFIVTDAAISQWWTHMYNLAIQTNTLHYMENIFGSRTSRSVNLHPFHTAVAILPTLQMMRIYEKRFGIMKELERTLDRNPLPDDARRQLDAEERRIDVTYLYDRAILNLCVRASLDPDWLGPGGARYLWGVKDHDRLDPYAHQHIACLPQGEVIVTATPSLLLLAEIAYTKQTVSTTAANYSHPNNTTGDFFASNQFGEGRPPVIVNRQQAWPLFLLFKRKFLLSINEPNLILVGVTFVNDSVSNEKQLKVVVRAPVSGAQESWLLSITWSLHLLLESSTTLSVLMANGKSESDVIDDDRLGLVKNQRYSSTRGFAVVPERPDDPNKERSPPMGLRTFTNDPPYDVLPHLRYGNMSLRANEGEKELKWLTVPRLSAKQIVTPPAPRPFNSTGVRSIDADMANDPRLRAARNLRGLLRKHRLENGPSKRIASPAIQGAISDLWTTRDAANWRTRYVAIEFGILMVIFLERNHLRVIGIPFAKRGGISSWNIPLWSNRVPPHHYDRMSITCVHQGVIIVERLHFSEEKKQLEWSCVVVRLTSFHPVNKRLPDRRAMLETYSPNDIPASPLVSKSLNAFPVTPYGQTEEHTDTLSQWTL